MFGGAVGLFKFNTIDTPRSHPYHKNKKNIYATVNLLRVCLRVATAKFSKLISKGRESLKPSIHKEEWNY